MFGHFRDGTWPSSLSPLGLRDRVLLALMLLTLVIWAAVYMGVRAHLIERFVAAQVRLADSFQADLDTDSRALPLFMDLAVTSSRHQQLVQGGSSEGYAPLFERFASIFNRSLAIQILAGDGRTLFTAHSPSVVADLTLTGAQLQSLHSEQARDSAQVRAETYLVAWDTEVSQAGFLMSVNPQLNTEGQLQSEIILSQPLSHLLGADGRYPSIGQLLLTDGKQQQSLYGFHASPADGAPDIGSLYQPGHLFVGNQLWVYRPLALPALILGHESARIKLGPQQLITVFATDSLARELAYYTRINLVGALIALALFIGWGRGVYGSRRKQALLDVALATKKHQLLTILELTGAIHWTWSDADARVTLTGKLPPCWQALVDADGSLPRAKLKEVIHATDWTLLLQQVDELRKGRCQIMDAEFRVQAEATGWQWFRMQGYISGASEGCLPQFSGSLTDIQPQKVIEMRLQSSEQRYRQEMERLIYVLDKTDTCIWELNLTSGLVTVSENWRNQLGYDDVPMEGFSRERVRELIHPDDLPTVLMTVETCLQQVDGMFECEARMRHHDGHWVWLWLSWRVDQLGTDGRPQRLVGVQRNIEVLKHSSEALEASRQQFLDVINILPVGISIVERDTQLVHRNPVAIQMFEQMAFGGSLQQMEETLLTQASQGEISTQPFREVFSEGHALLEAGPVRDEILPIKTCAGQYWLNLNVRTIDEGNKVLLAYTDISELVMSRNQLRQAASVFSYVDEAIIIVSKDLLITSVNTAFERVTGYESGDIIGKPLDFLRRRRFSAVEAQALMEQLHRDHRLSGIFESCRKNGEPYTLRAHLSVVHDDFGEVSHYIVIFSDITEMLNYQQQLERQAHHDTLTGLPNRSLLHEKLRAALAVARRNNKTVAVGFIDLDGFKAVNDVLGHDAGDRLLVTVSQQLQCELREIDSLIRLGGDEFVVILVQLDEPKASLPILDRMILATDVPLLSAQLEQPVSASIGVAFFPQECSESADLLKQADKAMYMAKRAGKGRWYSQYLADAEGPGPADLGGDAA